MIFESRFETFLAACQNIDRRREKLAMPVIHGELAPKVDAALPNDALLSHIIAESLVRRVDRQLLESKNIYLEKFDISQIDLFYMMCKAYPHVPLGHAIANQYLCHAARGIAHAAFLDIGIGKGVQARDLILALAKEPGKLERLTVIALDPNEDNIAAARANVEAAAAQVRFPVTYHTVPKFLEALTPDDFRALADVAQGGLLVNSAYSFHHTAHGIGDGGARTKMLQKVAGLSPKLFTLVEPNADHDGEHLPRRLAACWEHFGTVFDLIDEADLEASHKFVVKEKFFGREIRDIFGTSDAFRCERHEPYESWLLRLVKAGFSPYPRIELQGSLPSHSSLDAADGLVRLRYRNAPLIAVFAYAGPAEGHENHHQSADPG